MIFTAAAKKAISDRLVSRAGYRSVFLSFRKLIRDQQRALSARADSTRLAAQADLKPDPAGSDVRMQED